jgi:hypothetical protein
MPGGGPWLSGARLSGVNIPMGLSIFRRDWVSGGVKLRADSSPQTGHGQVVGAVPIGAVISKTPSESQR